MDARAHLPQDIAADGTVAANVTVIQPDLVLQISVYRARRLAYGLAQPKDHLR